ncbi:MAG TPA: flavoprotein [Candidatus Omnitrophota bacterium]|nr:flavoprotein [Candidatus Omnitrophota bacterium]HPN87939.1 flavoprotein [Candidatus Omnitrophota bacterium]
MNKLRHIILGVTGSIAAYKAAELVRLFMKKRYKVSVVMTQEAKKFITPLTLSRLSQNKVYQDMFENDGSSWDIEHVDLAQSADAVVIAPATANVISKIACGLADDLLTCITLATKAKIVIAPAMNEGMYTNKIFQENVKKLEKNGIKFVGPVKGDLACGTKGVGHIASEEEIVKEVERSFK